MIGRFKNWFQKWELLALLWLAFFLNQADRQIFSIVIPLIKAELHLTDTQLGLIASILVLAYGVCVPLAGFAGDWMSKRNVIGFSLVFWSVATFSTGLCYTLVQFVLLRGIATGGGEAFYAPSANALIGIKYPRQKSFALSVHQSAVYFGIILSGLIVGHIAESYGWRIAFYCFGAAGIIIGLIFLFRIRPEPDKIAGEALSITRAFALFIRTPTVITLTMAFACMVFVNVAYLTWMPTLFVEKYSLSLANAGFYSMFSHHAGAFLGIMSAGYFSDRLAQNRPVSRLYLQAVALIMAAPFIYLTGRASSVEFTCVYLFLFGILRGSYDANIFASLFEVIPVAYRSSVSGLMLMLAFLVGSASPAILGYLKSITSLSEAFSNLGWVYVVGGTFLLIGAIRFFNKDYLKLK